MKLYFLKSRDDVLDKFEQFCYVIGKPGTIVADGAKEFVSRDFQSFCREEGIRRGTSAPYTPEENGIKTCVGNCCWYVEVYAR